MVNNGLKLNKDFTLTNAVAVATTHKGTQVMSRVLSNESCNATYEVYSDSDTNDLKLNCSCGEQRYFMDFAFSEGGNSSVVLR